MKENGTASSLMEVINQKKLRAIKDGIIRAEKPLEPISENEVPYELPMGWLWIRLGEYALKVTDYVASGSFAALKENVLITNEPNYAIMVKTADFSNGFTKNLTYTDRQGYDFLSNSNLFGGELILSNIGSIGKVFIVPYLKQPMTLASNTVMVKVTDDELIKYLYFYFLSPLGQRTLKGISSGTSMMKFNKTQLKNTLVPVAPLDKQKHIVGLLEKAQAIIEARQQELQKLDDLIKARFVEMFGHQSHNEKSLRYMTIDDVAEIYLGITHTPTYVDSGVMFISAKNTSGDFLDLSDVKYISREEFEGAPKGSKPQVNDVLFSRVGSNLGHPVILKEELELCTFVSLGFLRSKGIVTSNYLKHWMRDEFFAKQVSEHVKGGGQPNLNTGWLKEFKIIVPDLEKQKEFDDFCNQVDKSKVAVQKALEETQLLFDSLMQQYFG